MDDNIAAIIMSLTALLGSAGTLYVAWTQKGKVNADVGKSQADTDKSHAETYGLLSSQLKEAYEEIDKLRCKVDDLSMHQDYQEYLLRGIGRLTNQLASCELTAVWQPMTFDEFKKRQGG